MAPVEVFRLEKDDPREWIPPAQAAEAIRRAVADEREACAVRVEQLRDGGMNDICYEIAAGAIRARGM